MVSLKINIWKGHWKEKVYCDRYQLQRSQEEMWPKYGPFPVPVPYSGKHLMWVSTFSQGSWSSVVGAPTPMITLRIVIKILPTSYFAFMDRPCTLLVIMTSCGCPELDTVWGLPFKQFPLINKKQKIKECEMLSIDYGFSFLPSYGRFCSPVTGTTSHFNMLFYLFWLTGVFHWTDLWKCVTDWRDRQSKASVQLQETGETQSPRSYDSFSPLT